MSLVQRCAECGAGLGPGAVRCPSCGAPVTREIPAAWLLGLALAAVAVLGLMQLAAEPPPREVPSRAVAPERPSGPPTVAFGPPEPETLHVPQTINVRQGPGTNYRVVGQVHRGDSLQIRVGGEEWRRIAEGRFEDRYIYTPLLAREPIPAFEIVSWDWDPQPQFAGGEGAVVWSATVRNNTDREVDRVRVEFTAYSESGDTVNRDHFYAQDLPPRGEASVKAYADYDGREHTATLTIGR